MTRILITGVSGTGKSTVIQALRRRGYAAIDTDDDGWHEWRTVTAAELPPGVTPGPDRVWREDRLRDLLAREDGETLFVAGTASNQGRFYDRFDHIILLSAPKEVIVERLTIRANNPYGKDPAELADTQGYIETVEPLLRRGATLEIDTRLPLDEVITAILDHARGESTGPA